VPAPWRCARELQSNSKNKRSIVALSVLLAVLLVAAAAGIGYMIWENRQLAKAAEEARQAPIPSVDTSTETPDPNADQSVTQVDERVDNPIDFAALKMENPEIYAWLYIPNTNVNYPLLRSGIDDNFYLDHDRYQNYSPAGSLYTQSHNATDFSDPVTLVYGHDKVSYDGMFATLHNFEDPTFFANNDTFYIYTPGHILTYQVVAAYIYDDRHILNSFDFDDLATRESYFNYILHPTSVVVNVREGASLDTDDKLVQLSTCLAGVFGSTSRFIVSGVLVDDQPTY